MIQNGPLPSALRSFNYYKDKDIQPPNLPSLRSITDNIFESRIELLKVEET
jgi:hypothetical protein